VLVTGECHLRLGPGGHIGSYYTHCRGRCKNAQVARATRFPASAQGAGLAVVVASGWGSVVTTAG